MDATSSTVTKRPRADLGAHVLDELGAHLFEDAGLRRGRGDGSLTAMSVSASSLPRRLGQPDHGRLRCRGRRWRSDCPPCPANRGDVHDPPVCAGGACRARRRGSSRRWPFHVHVLHGSPGIEGIVGERGASGPAIPAEFTSMSIPPSSASVAAAAASTAARVAHVDTLHAQIFAENGPAAGPRCPRDRDPTA